LPTSIKLFGFALFGLAVSDTATEHNRLDNEPDLNDAPLAARGLALNNVFLFVAKEFHFLPMD
jgi:hypothetical protein